MKVLIIGGGGREHAIAWKLSQSRHVDKIYSSPGNPGIAEIAECIDVNPADFRTLIDFVKYEWIDLTVVCSEQDLAGGIVNVFEREGCKILGPDRFAAQLQSSRIFAKNFMRLHRIPTADYRVFSSYLHAQDYVRMKGLPVVIKTDGHCGNGGIFFANTEEKAFRVLKLIMKEGILGYAGRQIIIEEGIKGERISFTALTDGKTILPFATVSVYRNVLEDGQEVTSRGLGAYSPAPVITKELETLILAKILKPLQRAFEAEGMKYRGVISVDLTIGEGSVRVFDVICCFGGFEAQTMLPRLKSDLGDVLLSLLGDKLPDTILEWEHKVSVCIGVFSKHPPLKSGTGLSVAGLEEIKKMKDVVVFHENAFSHDADDIKSGDRVLDIAVVGDDLRETANRAYEAVRCISFEGMYYRKDIGYK